LISTGTCARASDDVANTVRVTIDFAATLTSTDVNGAAPATRDCVNDAMPPAG